MSAAELILTTGSAPAAPASGRVTLYAGTDDSIYITTSAGSTRQVATLGAAQTFTAAQSFSDNVTLGGSGKQVGFYGATPISRPVVSGVQGGNTALGSLLSALAALGLIVDSTTL
jgi:hypothetical protein